MRAGDLALAMMLVAAWLVGSGCSVVCGIPVSSGAAEVRLTPPRGAAPAAPDRLGAEPLTGEEILALGRLEAASGGLEEFRGGYYYGTDVAGAYYHSPGEDFIYVLLGLAALAGLVIFIKNNADEAHFHTDNLDVYIQN